MNPTTLKFEFTVDQFNVIYATLCKTPLPYEVSAPVIAEIQRQVQSQVQVVQQPTVNIPVPNTISTDHEVSEPAANS